MKNKTGSMKINWSKAAAALLALAATLTLHCRFEIYTGGFANPLLNGVNKLTNTFIGGIDFLDLFAVLGLYLLLRFVFEKEKKIDLSSLLLSVALAVLLLFCISFEKYNSPALVTANSYQILSSVGCVLGFSAILYGTIRGFACLLQNGSLVSEKMKQDAFYRKHFLPIGAAILFLSWIPWVILNYPGSGCPDSTLQIQQFLGLQEWSAGHPPLSSLIMGGLFSLGSALIDPNFGFFLYCLLQICVGALVFSLSMKKLLDLGISYKWCMAGIFFFAFTPLWATYAQWVEKDFLYTGIAVLQTVCMMDILIRKECSAKQLIPLLCSSLLAVFLRNNGIYAILPALLFLGIWLKKAARRRVLLSALILVVIYESVLRGLFPALGIHRASIVEALGIPFQQTARYVCEFPDEVTEEEKEVLGTSFEYGQFFSYNPVLTDPIKNAVRNFNLADYMKVWLKMFPKHPGCYVSAFLNIGYGYLAPVSQNIEAWIQMEYYDSMKDLGLYHVFSKDGATVLSQIWYQSATFPLVKYLCTPGLYTWVIAALTLYLLKKRRFSALILFVPSYMNILVCLASPMASAIRYELPTVASVPLLIGWTFYSLHRQDPS